MQGRLSSALRDKILSLDIREPYVWRLKLSETDFKELEACLSAFIADRGNTALSTTENAIYGVVYLAEWYKRKYQSGNKCDLMDGVDVEQFGEETLLLGRARSALSEEIVLVHDTDFF